MGLIDGVRSLGDSNCAIKWTLFSPEDHRYMEEQVKIEGPSPNFVEAWVGTKFRATHPTGHPEQTELDYFQKMKIGRITKHSGGSTTTMSRSD